MAKKKPKIHFEDISNKLAGMEEKQHIDQISPAVTDVYIKHAKYKDKQGVTRFKRKFNKKDAGKLAEDLFDTLGYHTHKRFFGMGDSEYKQYVDTGDVGHAAVALAGYQAALKATQIQLVYMRITGRVKKIDFCEE